MLRESTKCAQHSKSIRCSLQSGQSPGLGLELDRDQLGKLHDQYLTCGIRQRDDVKQMQRYKPEWKALKPRF